MREEFNAFSWLNGFTTNGEDMLTVKKKEKVKTMYRYSWKKGSNVSIIPPLSYARFQYLFWRSVWVEKW